jgi:outer membrane receptor protein involved in Fe transport
LKPETGKTYTLGLVLAPTRDLSATIDYFDIRIDNTISQIDGSVIFTQCLDTGDPFYCSLVTRDPASGALWYGGGNVIAINQNIGKTRVAGTDVAVNYRWRLPEAHGISFDGLGTWLRTSSIQLFRGGPTSECAGLYLSDCTAVPLPKWRHRLRVTWQPPWNVDLSATWRYVGSTKADPAVIASASIPPVVVTQPAMSYLDLAGSWNITKQITLRGGVNNVADRDPPLVAIGGAGGTGGSVNGNAFAQVYDVLGRHVFVALTVKF